MKAFQASMAKLEGSDTQVLGVSVDSPFANHAFAQANGITFPLLGDMAPDFTLLAYDGSKTSAVSLHDFKGKKQVALAFYVFAFTGG